MVRRNVEVLASTQRYYEKELEAKERQITDLQKIVSGYELETRRAEMKLRHREATIAKLRQGRPLTDAELREEATARAEEAELDRLSRDESVRLLQEKTQRERVQEENEKLRGELELSPSSLAFQLKGAVEMAEELNGYLKRYMEGEDEREEEEVGRETLMRRSLLGESLLKSVRSRVSEDEGLTTPAKRRGPPGGIGVRAVEELTRIKLYYGEKLNKLMALLREANQGQERVRKEMEEQERYLKELHEERFAELAADFEEKVRAGE